MIRVRKWPWVCVLRDRWNQSEALVNRQVWHVLAVPIEAIGSKTVLNKQDPAKAINSTDEISFLVGKKGAEAEL